ncbi:hypothetical protein [Campylobacter sp. RM16187]|uniref:hypothetical protein n=1 Tax=Campylobacter sp. RM16187 TaxID=1660063 RepID=UPI0021B54CDB|nr:hypothetical protein [Campylobacter sp. RM16187]QKG30248.1 hypothetical protein CDOMF_2029 [Campylobacter sp. RM16187]
MRKILVVLAVFASLNLFANEVSKDNEIICNYSNLGIETKKTTKAKQIMVKDVLFSGSNSQNFGVKKDLRQTCEVLNCVMDDSVENKQAFFKNATLTILNGDDEISNMAVDYFSSREFDFAKKLRHDALLLKFGCDYELMPIETRNGVNKVFVKAIVMSRGKEIGKIEINGRVLAIRGKFGMVQDMQVYNLKLKEIKE